MGESLLDARRQVDQLTIEEVLQSVIQRLEQIRAAEGTQTGIADVTDQTVSTLELDEYRKVIESSTRPSFIAGAPFQFDQSTDLAQVTHAPTRIEAFRDYFASWRKWRWFGVSSFVVRRDAFQSVGGFSPEWINGEDADLAIRLGVAAGFVSIEQPATFAYRSHANQETANFLRTARGVMRLVDSEREAQYPGGHERRFERRRIFTRHVRPVTLESLRIGSPGLAINLFENTLWWNLCERRFRYLAGFAFSALVRLARSQVGASLTSFVGPKSK
jgi:GT2 family glycosyltransferase